MTLLSETDGGQNRGATASPSGSRPSDQAQLHGPDASRFDPSRRPPALMMGNVMLVAEEELGRKGVWPHHKRLPKWFIPADWTVWPVLAYDKCELHIIAISSARRGAFKRLVAGAQQAGLTPVVVTPFGQMTAIMRRWGWQQTIVGEGWDVREEWRPASGIETEGHDRAAGRGAEHESPTAKGGDAQDIAEDIGGPSQ